jgi:3-methyladenine DNA glycosylase AlkD
MTTQEALKKLERLGTAQNRKVYGRHGVGPKQFGVSWANLRKLSKQIGCDRRLAKGLWKSGNYDARILATMIADPHDLDLKTVDSWVRDLDNYVVTDAFSGLLSQTPLALKKMEQWTTRRREWVATAGWNLLVHIAMQDQGLPDSFFLGYVRIIEGGIHHQKNRVRHSMNAALIAIGMRNKKLERNALVTARRIGEVVVDHGETSCTTPDAVAYIKKVQARRASKGKKR